MVSNKVPRIIKWWATPKLPNEHIFIPHESKPKGLNNLIRVYFRKWLIHPVKRRTAKYYLMYLQKFYGLKVIGITGSAGKTTVKDMTALILKQKGRTVSSYKNIDPVYNIPSSILKCRPGTKYLVLEMGVEFPGEMDYYLWLAKPSIGVITNVYPTHTEFFKNTDGVFREKVRLVSVIQKDGFVILNSEDKYTPKAVKKTKAKVILFGIDGKIKAKDIRYSRNFKSVFQLNLGKNKMIVKLPVLGKQFVSNALAAASVGDALGIKPRDIVKAFQKFRTPEHRMEIVRMSSGALILDDSYNNNPNAAIEAFRTLDQISNNRHKILIFGDMLELGKQEVRYHKKLGKVINSYDMDEFIAVGTAARETYKVVKKRNRQAYWVKEERDIDEVLKPLVTKNSIILVKGSRSIGLDKLVSRLSV